MLELKQAAFRRLSHGELLTFLGLRGRQNLEAYYKRIYQDLSDGARAFWNTRIQAAEKGLLQLGGFEDYYSLLRSMLRLVIGRRKLEHLFTLPFSEQRSFYEKEWNTLRWRTMIRLGCSKYILGRRLDPSWFTHAEVASQLIRPASVTFSFSSQITLWK